MSDSTVDDQIATLAMAFRNSDWFPTDRSADAAHLARFALIAAGYVIVKPLRISAEDAPYFGDGLDDLDGRANIRTLQELGLPIEVDE